MAAEQIYSCHTFIESGLDWRNWNRFVNILIYLIGSLFRFYSPFCNELSPLKTYFRIILYNRIKKNYKQLLMQTLLLLFILIKLEMVTLWRCLTFVHFILERFWSKTFRTIILQKRLLYTNLGSIKKVFCLKSYSIFHNTTLFWKSLRSPFFNYQGLHSLQWFRWSQGVDGGGYGMR